MPTPARSYPDMDRIDKEGGSQLQDMAQQKPSNKRKRDSPGLNGRTPRQASTPDNTQSNGDSIAPLQQPYYTHQANNNMSSITQQVTNHIASANASSSTAAAALAASMPQLTVPQPTELSFPSTNSGNDEDRQLDSSFDLGPDNGHQTTEGASYNLGAYTGTNGDQLQGSSAAGPGKPPVGSDEWHKVRKDNHKEVERRRRETINEGINELAKIVPGCDKNKGAVLQRSVQYITQLKDNESTNIEKWTLEKMLTDQAIAELTTSVDKLKEELAKTRREAERWRTRCEAAGVDVDAEETAAETGRGR